MMANGANDEIGMSLRKSVTDHRSSSRAETSFTLSANPKPAERNWSAALDLVHEASEAIRIRDERAIEMEIEHRLDAERASEDIRSLQERLDDAERRIVESDERAQAAEMRASGAEAWLAKLHYAIVSSFSGILEDDAAARTELRAVRAQGRLGRVL